jgi:hypothetical protein
MSGRKRLVAAIKSRLNLKDKIKHRPVDPTRLIQNLIPFRDEKAIGRNQLVQIASVKAVRSKSRVSRNSDEFVKTVTKIAFGEFGVTLSGAEAEKFRISTLCALSGVGVPMASAILAWVFPDRWPVIDQKAWRSISHIYAKPNRFPEGHATRLTADDWAEYKAEVCEVAAICSLRPVDVDQWLYAFDDLSDSEKRELL